MQSLPSDIHRSILHYLNIEELCILILTNKEMGKSMSLKKNLFFRIIWTISERLHRFTSTNISHIYCRQVLADIKPLFNPIFKYFFELEKYYKNLKNNVNEQHQQQNILEDDMELIIFFLKSFKSHFIYEKKVFQSLSLELSFVANFCMDIFPKRSTLWMLQKPIDVMFFYPSNEAKTIYYYPTNN